MIKTLLFFSVLVGINLYFRFQVHYNSPHMDESDYLFVGRLLWNDIGWETKTYIFSSDIPLWFIGFADYLGGISAARLASSVYGLVSLLCVYLANNMILNSNRLAAFSTLILALQAPHMFISQFSTYDVLCFLCFSAAILFLIKSINSNVSYSSINFLTGTVLICLAVLCKYIVVVYVPLIAALMWWISKKKTLYYLLIMAGILGAYILLNWEALTLLYQNQIMGTHARNSSIWQILQIIFSYTAIPKYLQHTH